MNGGLFSKSLWAGTSFEHIWHDSARHGSVRHSTAQHGSVRLSLHFLIVAPPLLPWLLKNFFIPRRSIKLSLDSLLGYQWEERLYFLNRQRNSHFLVVKKRCAHSKQLRSILRWLCWFKSSGSVVSNVASSQWRFSPANQWSAEFTRHVLITVRFAWNLSRGGTEKSTRYQVSTHTVFGLQYGREVCDFGCSNWTMHS